MRRKQKRANAIVLESSVVLEDGAVRAVLIREGVSKNGNRWTRAAIEAMAKLVDGLPVHVYDFSRNASKSFLTHWGFISEQLKTNFPGLADSIPDRLSNKQVGKIADAQVVESDGKLELRSAIELDDEKGGLFRGLIKQAQRMGRALGISAHVPADGLESRNLSAKVREITGVSRVVGFDVVTFPSAGGRVLPVLEALVRRTAMRDWLVRLLRLVPEDRRPALEALAGEEIALEDILDDDHKELRDGLVEALELDQVDEGHLPAVFEAMGRVAPKEEKGKGKEKEKEKSPPRRAALESEATKELRERLERNEERTSSLLRSSGEDLIAAVLESEKLPEKLGSWAKDRLGAVLEAQGSITRKEATDFVGGLKKGLGETERKTSLLEANGGPPPSISFPEWTTGERCEAAFEALLAKERYGVLESADGKKEKVPAFQGLKQAYQVISGDWGLQGQDFYINLAKSGVRRAGAMESMDWEANPFYNAYLAKIGGALEAAQVAANFPLLLSNLMHKRLLKEYRQLAHVWNLIASIENVSDFKQRNIHQFGEFGNLSEVDEGATGSTGFSNGYVELTYPSEDDITATIAKHGGLAKFSWESIINDDLRKLRRIPGMMARAAQRTLNTAVWGKILNNSNIYDGTALFTGAAAHENIVAAVWSVTAAKTARAQMVAQKDLDDEEAARFRPRRMFCGPALIDEVWEDLGSEGKANLLETGEIGATGTLDRSMTHESPNKPNVLKTRYGLELYEIQEFAEVSGSEEDVLITDHPGEVDMMEVGFLNGMVDPSLFVQDLDKVGSMFDNDVITWKVRHVHDSGVVTDFRPWQLIQKP